MRSCLLTAFEHDRPAELAATFPTVEGDPLTTYYRVWPTADIAVEVFTDSSRDDHEAREVKEKLHGVDRKSA